MAGKSSDWRPGHNVCRCCFAEGCYKDISNEYFWMGKREVYAEMLSETFDVSISYSKAMGPNSNSRLICEPCISRLRDASDFKRQVLECEKMFMQQLDPGSSGSQVTVTLEPVSEKEEVKLEKVKTEQQTSDDDFDDHFNMDDDDDDDLDIPLTKLATKVPKKESVDLLDLLDNARAEKRKAPAKPKAVPPKKPKKNEIVIKATTSKAVAKPAPKPEKKKAATHDPARRNAEIIIKNATAYPFRVNDKTMNCGFCQDSFQDPAAFRAHVAAEHENFNISVVFFGIPKAEFVKADITELKCRICLEQHSDLEAMAKHLKDAHNKEIDLDGKLGVMPYIVHKDAYNCAVCSKNFPSLFHLNRHTITHFLSFVCHVCGSSYIASTGLLRHVRSKHQEYSTECKRCKKEFPTIKELIRHKRMEKSCLPYCCPKCGERFADYKSRKTHMETLHGIEKKILACNDCQVTFASDTAYYEHFKLRHSNDCVSCKHCGLKLLNMTKLKRHMKRHSL